MREPIKTSSRGASLTRTGVSGVLASWWDHHRQSAISSLQRLLSTPVQSLMTSAVVAIALALPALLLLALNNVQDLGERWDARPSITVFIDGRAKAAAIESLLERMRQMPGVERVTYLSADEALAQFQAQSGFGEVLHLLDDNPLPPTAIVTPVADAATTEQMTDLVGRIAAEPLVAEVDADLEWVERLQHLLELARKVVLTLAVLLGLGVLLAIGNTIRLAIESRRDEIIVTKLVGATDRYVRRPFLYTGAWYGLLGGVLACLMMSVGLYVISGPVEALAGSYQSSFQLRGLGFAQALSVILTSVVLGWLGAGLAVGHHLGEINPE